MLDLAIASQDPELGGGARAQIEAFWNASVALGRAPRLVYSSRERSLSLVRRSAALAARLERDPPFVATVFPAFLPELDALHQVVGGARAQALLRTARSRWVVSTAASYGLGALWSGRPYACWIGTGLDDEWRTRAPFLPAARRAALRVNAPFLRRAERAVLRGAARVYATSEGSRRSVAAAGGLDPARVGVLPIPVDAGRFPPEADADWVAALERPVLAFVGRGDDPRKNLGLLLRALPLIRRRVPAARLRVVGTAPAAPAAHGVDVLGPVPDVGRALDGVAVFVLPSLQEGFGVVVAEALAKGVPAVVTPCEGPEELVRASGGGTVTAGFRPEELADAVVELLRDPERLLAMRASGREYVLREHSPRRLAEALRDATAELDG